MTTLLTWIGLALTLAGTACAGIAFRRTWSEHGSGPFWPWLAMVRNRTRHLLARLMPWFRRDLNLQVHAATAIASAMDARISVTGPAVPDDLPVAEQIRLLVTRVERIESEAAADREQAQADVRSTRAQMNVMAERLTAADQRLESITQGLAVGTLRLQVLGLVLVGIGTIVMAIPVLFG